MFRVTIRPVEYLEDYDFDHVFLGLDNAVFLGAPMSCLVALDAPSSSERVAAVHGWVKVLGLGRREFMKSNGAPAWLIEASTFVDGILNSHVLIPAPGFFRPFDVEEASHWLLENTAESWLISVTRNPARIQPSRPDLEDF